MLSVAEALHACSRAWPSSARARSPAEASAESSLSPMVRGARFPVGQLVDGWVRRAGRHPRRRHGRSGEAPIVGEVPAGTVADRALAPGQAYRSHGRPLPPGSDAVVPQEDVRRAEAPGARETRSAEGMRAAAGEDIRPGDRLLEPGTVLRPRPSGSWRARPPWYGCLPSPDGRRPVDGGRAGDARRPAGPRPDPGLEHLHAQAWPRKPEPSRSASNRARPPTSWWSASARGSRPTCCCPPPACRSAIGTSSVRRSRLWEPASTSGR